MKIRISLDFTVERKAPDKPTGSSPDLTARRTTDPRTGFAPRRPKTVTKDQEGE